jgi:hypothetical protein
VAREMAQGLFDILLDDSAEALLRQRWLIGRQLRHRNRPALKGTRQPRT